MRLFLIHISLFTLFACGGQEAPHSNNEVVENNLTQFTPKQGGDLYANEYGEIELVRVNDSIMRTIFRNNKNDEFDTLMKILPNFPLYKSKDSLPFLSLGGRGIQMSEYYLEVMEFTSLLFIDQFIQIEHMYDRPFFKLGSEVKLEGDVSRGKGRTVNEIWFEKGDVEGYNLDYAIVYGVLHKEPYPRSYYSTAESPQGMFAEGSGPHYRLIFEDADFEAPPLTVFEGYPVNTSSGQAAIAWEFADSEAYIIEGHEPWTEKDLSKKIAVKGYLVQNRHGSYLKNWEIIE
ncbi:MAG: hypothetical protein HUJ25_06295 [Crocinitomicaceae bacterium]|nr:hypothetical protein [Crocinitomicaceae bacterium]